MTDSSAERRSPEATTSTDAVRSELELVTPGAAQGKLTVVVIVAVAVAAVLALRWLAGNLREDAAASVGSIVVLPLTDMSPNGDLGYYADGLAEEITTTLAEAENLRVIPRTTASHYRGMDLGTIAAEIDVDGVLQGSVRKSGDILRISMQLIRASDGRQLWSANHDRLATDAFEVQEEIARTVAATLERRLTTAQLDEPRFRPEPGAFETYLKASFEQDLNTPASIQRSIRLFEETLDQDPDFAPTYAGLVNSYILNILWGFTPPDATRVAAGEAAERSLGLGGAHAEAIGAAAAYHTIYEWDIDGAQELLASAEEQDAPAVRFVRGLIAAARGRADEALQDLRAAQASAPYARLPSRSRRGSSS